MPCFLALLGFFTPRLVLVALWLFTGWIDYAYRSHLWPLLGFFFMPTTTLAYAAAIHWNNAVEGVYFFMVLVAALVDLGVVGGGAARSRARWT